MTRHTPVNAPFVVMALVRYRAPQSLQGEGAEYFASNHVARILASLVAPDEVVTERLKDQFGVQATATGNLNENYMLQFNMMNSATGLIDLPVQNSGLFLFRDPLRHTIQYNVAPDELGRFYRYDAQYADSNVDPDQIQNYTRVSPAVTVCLTDSAYWTNNSTAPPGAIPLIPATATAWAPHGPYCFSGYYKELSGVYLDCQADTPNTAAFVISWAAPLPSGAPYQAGDYFEFTLWKFNGGDWDVEHTQRYSAQAAMGAAGQTIIQGSNSSLPQYFNTSGYYAVTLTIYTQSTTSVRAQDFAISCYSRSNSCFAHQPLNGLSPLQAAGLGISALRMTGASLLVKNQASPLYQQGAAVILQAESSQDWLNTYVRGNGDSIGGPGLGFFNYVFNQATEKDFRLANGLYGYLRPTGFDDFKWIQDISYTDNVVGVACMQFPLKSPTDFLVVALECTNQNGGDLLLKFSDSVEYKTLNMWIEKMPATTSVDDWTKAMEILPSMTQFCENPSHLATMLGQILASVGKYAPLAAPLLAAIPGIGEVLGPVAMGVGAAASAGAALVPVADQMVDAYKDARKKAIRTRQEIENKNYAAFLPRKVQRTR